MSKKMDLPLFIMLLAIFADTAYAQDNGVQCPLPFVTGLFVYPPDCRQFINCWNGQAFLQQCGPGTAFNPLIGVCDWPNNVDCSGSYGNTNNDYYNGIGPNNGYNTGNGQNDHYNPGNDQNTGSENDQYPDIDVRMGGT